MTADQTRRGVRMGLLLSAVLFALLGAEPVVCTPTTPETPVCLNTLDCAGLPHPCCPGEWYCEEGLCAWECEPVCDPPCVYPNAQCVDGVCVCEPDCSNAACGDDGCGSDCGQCPAARICEDGDCVMEMLEVPEGPFWMGCNEDIDVSCSEPEYPFHEVFVSSFEMDKTEVTVADYELCAADGMCPLPSGGGSCNASLDGKLHHPANCTNWERARSYCEWAGKRLCTEAEWEKAARGTDARLYPWGNEDPDCTLAALMGCPGGTLPVDSLPEGAGPYGHLHLAGNVWEWTADVYDEDYYSSSPYENPTGPEEGDYRVYRGGSYMNIKVDLRTSRRALCGGPQAVKSNLGFRCCRTPQDQ